MEVKFKPISTSTAAALIGFATWKNISKSIEIDGKTYTLDGIYDSTSKRHRSRGISVYYRTGRSIVRISDHWSKSSNFPRSKKLNCGPLGGHDVVWTIHNRGRAVLECRRFGGHRFPHRMLAGIAGLAVLNRSVPHWNPKADDDYQCEQRVGRK